MRKARADRRRVDTGPAHRRLFGGYLGLSLAGVVVHAFLPDGASGVSYFLIALAAVPAMAYGATRCVPQGRRTSWLLVAALAVLGCGNLSIALANVGLAFPGVVTNTFFTLGNTGLLVAALSFVRLRGRNDVGGLLDAAVVSVAGGGLLWTAALQPRLDDLGIPLAAQPSLLFNVLVLTGVLGALVRLELTAQEPLLALRLVISALLLNLIGTIAQIVQYGTIGVDASLAVQAGYLVAYALVGAAGLHPSLRLLATPGPAPAERLVLSRLVFLGAALAVPPVAGAGRELFGLPVDGLLLAVNTLIAVPLVMIRVGYLASQRIRAENRLVHQATHDALTGLANRAEFLTRLDATLARRAADGRQNVLLLFCDLDGFKAVNDRLGHAVGDELLISVARRLARTVAGDDTLARYGGDEFLILCETTNPVGARTSVSRRIVGALADPFDLAGERIAIGISIGAAVADADDSADTLISRADAAMYAAKERRRIPYQRSA